MSKEMIIRVLKTDTVLESGRLYPRHVVESAIEKFSARDICPVQLGQCNNEHQLTADCEKTLGILSNLKIEENGDVMGTLKLMDTPNGKIMSSLLEGPVLSGWGIGLRAYGELVPRDDYFEISNLDILTFDLVDSPIVTPFPKVE